MTPCLTLEFLFKYSGMRIVPILIHCHESCLVYFNLARWMDRPRNFPAYIIRMNFLKWEVWTSRRAREAYDEQEVPVDNQPFTGGDFDPLVLILAESLCILLPSYACQSLACVSGDPGKGIETHLAGIFARPEQCSGEVGDAVCAEPPFLDIDLRGSQGVMCVQGWEACL